MLRVGRIDIGLLFFTSHFDPDSYNSTTREFLREFGKQPFEKEKLIMRANMGETKDLIVMSASTEYVSILFLLFLRDIIAFSITVADTEVKRKGS